MAKLGIEITTDAVLMTLGGRLDAEGVALLWPQARAALTRHEDLPVRVEAAGVDYCDGAGLAFLMDIQRQRRDDQAAVEIVHLPARFQALLETFDPAAFPPGPLSSPRREAVFARVGRSATELVADLKSQIAFIGEGGRAVAYALRHPGRVRWGDVLAVAEAAGVDALPIVSLVAFLIGVIVAYQSALAMRQFGAEIYVADLIGISMVREMAPLMTAILLAGRSGSAFAAEIGTMRVNEEIDALTTFGFDPIRFLVVPRVLAALAVTPLLAIYADVVSIFGGALIMRSFQIPMVTYYKEVFSLVAMNDVMGGLFKCLGFGVVVAGIGCLRGLQTGTGAAAVGLSTTRAMVGALVWIVLVDGAFAIVYFHLGI